MVFLDDLLYDDESLRGLLPLLLLLLLLDLLDLLLLLDPDEREEDGGAIDIDISSSDISMSFSPEGEPDGVIEGNDVGDSEVDGTCDAVGSVGSDGDGDLSSEDDGEDPFDDFDDFDDFEPFDLRDDLGKTTPPPFPFCFFPTLFLQN